MINLRSLVFILSVLVSFTSCDDTQVYDQYITVSETWEKDEKVSFELPELDPNKKYNLFINVRNTNDYRYSNLFLIRDMKFPNGKVITDTLEYQMAAPDGKWLGVGFSDIKENKLWYKENINFTEEGVYTVTLQHAMRKNGEVSGINSLQGITEVGFRIEDTQNP